MVIRLRFYLDRFNMEPEYYCGDEDIYCRVKLDDINDLRRCWSALINDYEGETYSAWVDGECIIGGAFDPGDLENIELAYNDIMRRKSA